MKNDLGQYSLQLSVTSTVYQVKLTFTSRLSGMPYGQKRTGQYHQTRICQWEVSQVTLCYCNSSQTVSKTGQEKSSFIKCSKKPATYESVSVEATMLHMSCKEMCHHSNNNSQARHVQKLNCLEEQLHLLPYQLKYIGYGYGHNYENCNLYTNHNPRKMRRPNAKHK